MFYVVSGQNLLESEQHYHLEARHDDGSWSVLYSTHRILAAMTFAVYFNGNVPDTRELRGKDVDLVLFQQLDAVFHVYPILEHLYMTPITGSTPEDARAYTTKHLGLLMMVSSFLLRYRLKEPFTGAVDHTSNENEVATDFGSIP